MSKKIVLSVLLSLLLGILGANASVGGFPTYYSLGGLPYKCTAVKDGDGAWQWRTTVDDRIAFKINGTRLELGWLSVFGDAKRLVIQFGMGTLSDKALACIELPKDIGRQTLQKAKIVFSKGKEAQTMVAIDGLRTISRSFNFYPDTNGEDVLLTILKSYDVKKIIIGSNVIECQTPTHVTFAAMLDEWYGKFFGGNGLKPECTGEGRPNTVDVSKLCKSVGICGTGQSLDMVFVQGGTFAFKDQGTKTVNSFYIGRTEVTQKVWKAVMKANSSAWKGDNLPVTNVTYWQALEFCKKLSRLTGKKFRLPRDVEWEFAARGGIYSKGYKYPGSDNPLEVGWLRENSNSRLHTVCPKEA